MTSIELQSNMNIQLAPRAVEKKLRSKGNTISVKQFLRCVSCTYFKPTGSLRKGSNRPCCYCPCGASSLPACERPVKDCIEIPDAHSKQ